MRARSWPRRSLSASSGSSEPPRSERSDAVGLALREEDAALGFVGAGVFVDDDRHRVGGGVAVADDGVGDVFDQCALLIEAAALGQLDDYFRHTRSVR